MQLEGVRISWASKDKANTGWESCQWVGKGAVQASPRRGLARGVPNGTIMGGDRKKNQVTHQSSKPKPGKADTLGEHTQRQKTLICIFQGDLFGHLRDAHPIPSYQWRPKFGLGRKMNPSHTNKPGSQSQPNIQKIHFLFQVSFHSHPRVDQYSRQSDS